MLLSMQLLGCMVTAWVLWAGSAVNVGKHVGASLDELPHDSNCFTQGLVIYEGVLFESCGLYGQSSLRRVDLKTGSPSLTQSVSAKLFAEGLTVFNNTAYMLTWKSKELLMYNAKTLKLLGTTHLQTSTGEGWGLTTDGKSLIVSDGSDTITFFQFPATTHDSSQPLHEVRRVKVFDPINSRHISHLNELEFVDGKLYSNIWYKDVILQIDPITGNITDRYDMSNLYPKLRRSPRADCLNGIAYDPKDRTFLLTGKRWPKYYRVRLHSPPKDL